MVNSMPPALTVSHAPSSGKKRTAPAADNNITPHKNKRPDFRITVLSLLFILHRSTRTDYRQNRHQAGTERKGVQESHFSPSPAGKRKVRLGYSGAGISLMNKFSKLIYYISFFARSTGEGMQAGFSGTGKTFVFRGSETVGTLSRRYFIVV